MPKQTWKTLRDSINWDNEAKNAPDITEISQNDWQNLKFVNIDGTVYLKANDLSDKVSVLIDKKGNCTVVKMFDLSVPSHADLSKIKDTSFAWWTLGSNVSAVYQGRNQVSFLTMPYLKGSSSYISGAEVNAHFPSTEIFNAIFRLQMLRAGHRLQNKGIALDGDSQIVHLTDFNQETKTLNINIIGLMEDTNKVITDPDTEIVIEIELLLACIDDLNGHANLLRKYISFKDDANELCKAIDKSDAIKLEDKTKINDFIFSQPDNENNDFIGYDFTTYDQLPDDYQLDEVVLPSLRAQRSNPGRADPERIYDEGSSLDAKRPNPEEKTTKAMSFSADMPSSHLDSLGCEPYQPSSTPRLKSAKKFSWKPVLIGLGIALGVGLLLGSGIGAGLMFGGVAGTFVLSQAFGLSMNFGWSMAFNIGLFAAAGAVAAAISAGVGAAIYHGINYMKNRFRKYDPIAFSESKDPLIESGQSGKDDNDLNPDDPQEKTHNNQAQKLTPIVLSREFQRSLVNPDPNEYQFYADRTGGDRQQYLSGCIQSGTIDYDVKSKDLGISGIELRFKNCLRSKENPRLTRMVFDKMDSLDRLNCDQKKQAIADTFSTFTQGEIDLNENRFKTLTAVIANDGIYVASNHNENVAYMVVTDYNGKVLSFQPYNNSLSNDQNSYVCSSNIVDLPILGDGQKAHLIIATRGFMHNLPGKNLEEKEKSVYKYIESNYDWSATSLAEIANCNDKQGASDEASILVAEIKPNLPTRMLSVWESSSGLYLDKDISFSMHAQNFYFYFMNMFKNKVQNLLPNRSFGSFGQDMLEASTSSAGSQPLPAPVSSSPIGGGRDNAPSSAASTRYTVDGSFPEDDFEYS